MIGVIVVVMYDPVDHSLPSADTRVWPDSTWSRSSYAERGIDSLPILELVDSLANERFGPILSMLIIKDGYLVTEEYFWNHDSSTVRSAYSITKSFLSALVGIAIKQGELPEVGTDIRALLPQYADIFKSDSVKNSITMEHLLTMTPGFRWNEWNSATYGENDFDALINNDLPVALVLSRPLSDTPGQVFNYNSGCSIVISAILESATGMSAREYAKRHLFEPLGITNVTWSTLNEMTDGASGLAATPSDLARFGLLYARQGVWRGQQIIPLDWYRSSTTGHILTTPADDVFPFSTSYGYHWWTMRGDVPEVEAHFPNGLLLALGTGEQIIFVAPDHDLVIVMTARQLGQEAWEQTPIGLIFRYILRGIAPELYRDGVSEHENDAEGGD